MNTATAINTEVDVVDLETRVKQMYQDVAQYPEGEYHFEMGRVMSPDLAQTREYIEYGFSQYLLRTTTMSFCYNGREGEYALAAAKHRHLMISGIKFIEHIVDVVYQLREEQGNWKTWTKRDSLNDIGKLSNCTQTDSILYAEPDSE